MFPVFRKKEIQKGLSRFIKNEDGMTLPMLGLALFAMIGFSGLAVDIGRIQLVQARLSSALDAAGLAGGATVNTTNLATEVQKYMDLNFPAGYLGASAAGTSATPTSDNLVIDLVATTTVPTTFMALFGAKEVTITATSQITRKTSGLELVMVLDNTGSMSGSPLTSLKTAAKTLVNDLYGSSATVDHLWIGLVPFSQAVNIGTGHISWMDSTNSHMKNYTSWGWKGCVEARAGINGTDQYDITDDTPTSTDYYFTPYYNTSSWNRNAYCPNEITPLTAEKSTILAGINNMVASGNTHIDLGLIWGWHMLSPSWRGLWGGEMNSSGLPLDYGTQYMNKAVVLLTDGDNTESSNFYTAYGILSEGRISGETWSYAAENALDTKLLDLCDTMKDQGIYIYTIAYGSSISSNAKSILTKCSSGTGYYFISPSTTQLNSVFNKIADSLSNLRISK